MITWDEYIRHLVMLASLSAQQAVDLFDSDSDTSEETYELVEDLDPEWNNDDEEEFRALLAQSIKTPEIPHYQINATPTPPKTPASANESDDEEVEKED